MTVESLETVKALLIEDPQGFVAVWEYQHAITGKMLWSVERSPGLAATQSPYVRNPKLIFWEGAWLQ